MIYAKFIGYQEMGENEAPQPLFNIMGDHPRKGSTVFGETLKELGIEAPEVPAYEEWKKTK